MRADEIQHNGQRGLPEPPVEEGEIPEVTIETVCDQGDGIAKVDRCYVVIVPETQLGEQPIIEIDGRRYDETLRARTWFGQFRELVMKSVVRNIERAIEDSHPWNHAFKRGPESVFSRSVVTLRGVTGDE